MKNVTTVVKAIVSVVKAIVSTVAFPKECAVVTKLRSELDTTPAVSVNEEAWYEMYLAHHEEVASAQQEEYDNLSWFAEQEDLMSDPGHCEVCQITPVSHGVDVCPQCEDAADLSDEERYAREEEEMFRMEHADKPTLNPSGRRAHPEDPATESEIIRFHHISMDVEWTQQEIAELERYRMYLHVYAQDSLDYHEALLDTAAELETKREWLATIEAQRRDLMPEYFAR